jgi:hypothetical protein
MSPADNKSLQAHLLHPQSQENQIWAFWRLESHTLGIRRSYLDMTCSHLLNKCGNGKHFWNSLLAPSLDVKWSLSHCNYWTDIATTTINSPHAKGDVWENRAHGRSIMIFSPAWYKDQYLQDETHIHQTESPMLQWGTHRIVQRPSWSWHPQRLLRRSGCAGIQKADPHL